MFHTLGTAAKATGKSKATISRAIKNGRLSATKNSDGTFSIDPAELHRVYEPLQLNGDNTVELRASEASNETMVLRREIELLNERIQDLKDERDGWRAQADRLLLVHGKPREQRSLLSWLGFRKSD